MLWKENTTYNEHLLKGHLTLLEDKGKIVVSGFKMKTDTEWKLANLHFTFIDVSTVTNQYFGPKCVPELTMCTGTQGWGWQKEVPLGKPENTGEAKSPVLLDDKQRWGSFSLQAARN